MIRTLTILLVLGLLLVPLFNCGKEDTTPVSPNTDVTALQPGQNARGYFTMSLAPSGGPFSLAVGMAVVEYDDPLAVISCGFATTIDTTTLANAFNLESSGGDNIDLVFTWVYGPITSINIRPAENLDHNATYIFSLLAAQLHNIAGDMLDVDNDHIAGESPDDNLRMRFTTVQEGGILPGEPVPETDDVLSPGFLTGLFYLIGEDDVAIHWMDVSLGIYIADAYYDADGDFQIQALNEDVFNSSTIILREADTKTSVTGDISYDDASSSPTYYRLTFEPDDNLQAGKNYEFVLKAQQITDEEGNKLNDTGDIIYTFQTTNATHDSSVFVDDITPPTIDIFLDNGPTFTVEFSEEIDVTTISAATIVVSYSEEYVPGSFIIDRVVRGGSPTGFATAVTFSPIDSDIYSGSVTIRTGIKDLAGNNMTSVVFYVW